MIRTALLAAAVAALVAGGWGCTPSPGSLAGKTPAVRLAQMEQELTALKLAQAKLAEDAAATAASLRQERERAAGLAKERDDLRTGLAASQTERDARRAERDAARAKLDGFRQELRDLLAKVDGGTPTPSPADLGSVGF